MLCLLQADVKLINILQWANFLPADMAPEGIKTGHSDDRHTLEVSTAAGSSNGVPHLQGSNGRHHAVSLQQEANGLPHTNGRHSKVVGRS